MKEADVNLKEQCVYCQKSWNTSHCNELKIRVREECNFHCPFFIFDSSKYDEEYNEQLGKINGTT